MDFGVAIFPTHQAVRPGDVARLAEQRGQESLFFPEHTHRPADHSPHPSGRAGFSRLVHWLPSAGSGPVEQALDAWEAAITEFTGG